MPEVEVAVHEHQPEPTHPPQRKHAPEKDAAIPAQHQRETPAADDRPEPLGEIQRKAPYSFTVPRPRPRLYLRRVRGRCQAATILRTEPVHEAPLPQSGGEPADARLPTLFGRAQTEGRRGVDHHDG